MATSRSHPEPRWWQPFCKTILNTNPVPCLRRRGSSIPLKIDPVAKAYFANNLLPVSASGYVFPEAAAKNNFNEYLGKFDYNLRSTDTISGTFISRDNPILWPFGPSPSPPYNVTGFPVTYSTTTYFGSEGYTHTFTPALLRGPGQTNLDLSISKHFIIREQMDLELPGAAFNIFNHAEFQNPDTTIADSTFGQISTTYDPRILQLALHLRF